LRLLSTDGREKHTAEPMHFGTVIAVLNRSFRLVDRLESFRGTIRKM
jgi:hypothetical protein